MLQKTRSQNVVCNGVYNNHAVVVNGDAKLTKATWYLCMPVVAQY